MVAAKITKRVQYWKTFVISIDNDEMNNDIIKKYFSIIFHKI